MMKTSTKLLLSAFVILIIAIGIYNNALKAEFSTGNYKKPYHSSNLVNIKDFTEVEINSANLMDVEFKQGAYGVYNSKYNADSVTFTKLGNKLIVNIDLKEKPLRDTDVQNGVIWPVKNHRTDRITIICPKLTAINTSNVFTVNGTKASDCDIVINPVLVRRQAISSNNKILKDERVYQGSYNTVKSDVYSNIPVLKIDGFKLDSISVMAKGNQKVVFENSFINNLKLTAGSFSSVVMSTGFIQNANLQINAGAQLVSSNMTIPKLVYHISDSARLSISGASIKSFIKQQP
jgi:hypothetical protein